MIEFFYSRVKVSLLLILFLAPVFAAVWDNQLDEWLRQSHRYEPLMPVDSHPTAVAPQ